MSNTNSLYEAVTAFQRKQLEAYNAYMDVMKGLESAKGSQYYNDKKNAAMMLRKAAEDEARQEARNSLKTIMERMVTANRARKAIAPTAEQLSLLQAMKLRTNITLAELDQVANAMNGNAMGLGVVNDFAQEIAQKTGHPYLSKNYLSMVRDGYPVESMEKELKNIGAACSRIIESDGANRARGLAADRYNRMYGNVNRDTLERAEIAGSESEFFDGITSVPYDVLNNCLNGGE